MLITTNKIDTVPRHQAFKGSIPGARLPRLNLLNKVSALGDVFEKEGILMQKYEEKYSHAFGKNDIRGIYGDDITESLFQNTAVGFVNWLKKQTGKNASDMKITVAMDARLHSPDLKKALVDGLTSQDVKVVDLGLVPSPIGYYSEFAMRDVTSAMVITASHNPSEYNGLKMTFNKMTLDEKQIAQVKDETFKIFSETPAKADDSLVSKYDIIPDYIEDMVSRFGKIGEGVKVVTDCANATGGVVAPKLYKKLGCDVVELYTEPDGRFPNHHPNPSVEATLSDLKKKVVEVGADIGIAFDGDSDRIGIVTSEGKALTGDKLLLIYAQDMIAKLKNQDNSIAPTVVSEVKCSQVLFDTINKIGGRSIMCKTGHGYIKSEMKSSGALLAGEMSGHTFFKDDYFGYDDAVYAGCRIIKIISENKKNNPNFKIQTMLKPFEEVFTSDEVRYPCANNLKKSVLNEFKEIVQKNPDLFGDEIKDIVTLDGMRVVFDGGFALIRQSNTEPVFTLRFEGKTEKLCRQYQDAMISTLNDCLERQKALQA